MVSSHILYFDDNHLIKVYLCPFMVSRFLLPGF